MDYLEITRPISHLHPAATHAWPARLLIRVICVRRLIWGHDTATQQPLQSCGQASPANQQPPDIAELEILHLKRQSAGCISMQCTYSALCCTASKTQLMRAVCYPQIHAYCSPCLSAAAIVAIHQCYEQSRCMHTEALRLRCSSHKPLQRRKCDRKRLHVGRSPS
jgi:hypothetical protein